MKFINLAICSLMMLASACGGASREGTDYVGTTPETDRAAYLLAHFWDAMDWQDSTLLASDEFMEQNLVNYYNIMTLTDSATAARNVMPMLKAASTNSVAIERIAEITSRYLYNQNSPMYNPESYEVMLDALLSVDALQESMALRLESDRESLNANRPGTTAADFEMELRQGGRSTLSEVTKGVKTVLMFYDSDCEVCAKIEGWMASSGALNGALAKGEVRVVAVDIFTPDRDKWRQHAQTLPANWIVGYAPHVDTDEIYHVTATPAIYLIGKNGQILARDISDAQITHHVLTADF